MPAGQFMRIAIKEKPVNKTAALVVSASRDVHNPSLVHVSIRPLGVTLHAPPSGIKAHKLTGAQIGQVSIIGECRNGLLAVRCNCGLYEYRKREWAHKNKDKDEPSLATCAHCESRKKSKAAKTIKDKSAKEWRNSLVLMALAEASQKNGKPIDCTKKRRHSLHELKD